MKYIKQRFKFLFTLLIPLTFMACSDDDIKKEVPKCIEEKIKQFKKDDVANPPIEVWEWTTEAKVYYYITSPCCDQFNYLYDNDCNVVCAPDGGFTGAGCGDCPTFGEDLTKTLVWKDER